jgi:hypothetical protein
MTKSEQEVLTNLSKIVSEIKEQNKEFQSGITKKVEQIESKVVLAPANLEQEILRTAQGAINESVKAVLTGYSSPLSKLITSVVEAHSPKLRVIINDSFESVINMEEFKASIVSAFSHKVSRSIISNNEGLFDKVSNELKADPVFKSKMTLAVAKVVEECLKGE